MRNTHYSCYLQPNISILFFFKENHKLKNRQSTFSLLLFWKHTLFWIFSSIVLLPVQHISFSRIVLKRNRPGPAFVQRPFCVVFSRVPVRSSCVNLSIATNQLAQTKILIPVSVSTMFVCHHLKSNPLARTESYSLVGGWTSLATTLEILATVVAF